MVRRTLALAALCGLLSLPAMAQPKQVIATCGTFTAVVGDGINGTINTAGQECVSALVSVTTNYDKRVASTPTVQNAAYASTNCIGGFNAVTLTSGTGVAGLLQSVKVASVGGSTPTVTVYLFDASPAASTCTDKSTFTLNSADVAKVIGAPFALTLVAPTGTSTTFALQSNMALPFVEGGSAASGVSTIYYALVSGSTFTPASTTDIQVSIGASMDAN